MYFYAGPSARVMTSFRFIVLPSYCIISLIVIVYIVGCVNDSVVGCRHFCHNLLVLSRKLITAFNVSDCYLNITGLSYDLHSGNTISVKLED